MARLSPNEIAYVVLRTPWRGRDAQIAVAVALAESTGDPLAKNTGNSNGSVDYGLFQINSVHRGLLQSGADWKNPYDNALMAYKVWQQANGSWRPWVAYKNGAYLAHMARAAQGIANPRKPGTVGGPTDPGPLVRSPEPDILRPPGVGGQDLGLAAIANFFRFISDGDNWRRVGLFLFGLILLLIGLVRVTGDGKMSGVTKGALQFAATRRVSAK